MNLAKRGVKACAAAASVLLVATACGSSSSGNGGTNDGSSTPAGAQQHGGSVVDLLDEGFAGSWPSGLDPANNTTGGANLSINQAVYGGLFLLRSDNDGTNGHIVPNQAASGTLSKDAMTLTIKLRSGIKFTDGTPLNAKAVIWNFKRDTDSTCTCAPKWKVAKKNPFTSPDPLTVVVHFSEANAAILHNFPVSNINWIASPTAYKKMGAAKFKVKPVGAGPFKIVTNQLSAKVVAERNPNFFKKGKPYLDKVTFQSVGGDQPAYQALLAGQGQVYEGMSTPPVMKQAESNSKLQVTQHPGTSPYLVHFNTNIAPFNNIKARQAVYYATNWPAISKGLFDGKPEVVQGFTTPADLYYHKKTPGYRTFNLDKAKALVKQVGGIHIQLDTTAVYTAKEVMKALQTQWEKAGMDVTVKAYPLNGLIKRLNSGKWQSELATAGAWDPAVGTGIGFRFRSDSPYTGVKDKHLDTLLAQAVATSDDATRDKAYQAIAKYISDKAYGMFGFAFGPASVTVQGIQGPGLTTKLPAIAVNPGVIWSEVSTDKS